MFYGHTHPDFPLDDSKWEPLFSEDCPQLRGEYCKACARLEPYHGHINKVAWLAARFAQKITPGNPEIWEWGYVLGLWHDLGKFSLEWQDYLKQAVLLPPGVRFVDPRNGKNYVDHKTAGARYAMGLKHLISDVLAYAITGHHGGMPDRDGDKGLNAKLDPVAHPIYPYAAPAILTGYPLPKRLPAFLLEALRRNRDSRERQAHVMATFTRMLFSCLVDADFLATESFMQPLGSERRAALEMNNRALLLRMKELLHRYYEKFGIPAPNDAVNLARAEVAEACLARAGDSGGLFSFTVPTGGGKTLASLLFALEHALKHSKKRIIYVIPFCSIIEQNAEVFEEVFRPLIEEGICTVLQHHSHLEYAKTTWLSRLATENWDAPLVVTTAVQFYESLHASSTSRNRKLHRIANSVIVLDEAQCIPVELMKPCLDVLKELTESYRSTVVFCSATQPAVLARPRIEIGLDPARVTEIIPDPRDLYLRLQRVRTTYRGILSDADLTREILARNQALAIVNTRRHAAELFGLFPITPENFHLSALMCPTHRSERLAEIRRRLAADLPVRVVSTTLIEAGVDVDFPVVYRSLSGVDSIAQAAGRCNREGKLIFGELHVFDSDRPNEGFLKSQVQAARRVTDAGADPLTLDSVATYFQHYYNGKDWDREGIGALTAYPYNYQFKEIQANFDVIDDFGIAVIIPYDARARTLILELAQAVMGYNPAGGKPLRSVVPRRVTRGLQRYVVQLRPQDFTDALQMFPNAFQVLGENEFVVLTPAGMTRYSPFCGLLVN